MIVTGQTNSSRLNELKKFIVTTDITKQYFGNGSWTNNGVDFSQLEYSDVEEVYRAYGLGEDELRIYSENEDDLRKTTGPLLSKIVYYIDGIKYSDFLLEGFTTYEYTAVGTNSPDFLHLPIIKDPKKEKIIDRPKIDSDVFIVRQELSAFENNYLLEHIDRLSEITTFAGGNYFNVVNNT